MNLLLINGVLALTWCALFGDFSALMILIGFGVGYFALWTTWPLYGDTRYFTRLWKGLHLTVYFLYDLLVSSIRVAWDVITPPIHSRPGIVAMPLDAKTDLEITLAANLISLTPGTLSLDVSEDRRTLYVHGMFVDDPEALKRSLKDGMERRVLEVTQ